MSLKTFAGMKTEKGTIYHALQSETPPLGFFLANFRSSTGSSALWMPFVLYYSTSLLPLTESPVSDELRMSHLQMP